MTMQQSNYQKVEETTKSTFAEAEKTADELLSPYGEKDSQGSRTTPEAKVRIRRRKNRHGEDYFRVILFKRTEQKVNKDGEEDEPRGARPKKRRKKERVAQGQESN